MSKTANIITVAGIALIISGFVIWDAPRNNIELFLEKNTIQKTAHAYLKAEMKKDSRRIYNLLAPSSDYRRTHTYEEFLNDIAETPPLSIDAYKIIRIYNLRDNDNRQNYPGVDRFVQVEVEVNFTKSGPNSIYNYSFTFLKEKGRWYKG